jgi:hypothetical protein
VRKSVEFTGWTQVGCKHVVVDYIVGFQIERFSQAVDQYSVRLLEIKENLEKEKKI